LIVIGIDPGLITTGYGVVQESGSAVRLIEGGAIRGGSADDPVEQRLLNLYRGMKEVLQEFQPEAMAMEALYSHYAHPATAILMGHARGVLCLAAAEASIPVVHYSATQIKDYLVGSGHATKAQIQKMIQKQLGLDQIPSPHDVADALAVAICHCRFASSPLVSSLRSGRMGVRIRQTGLGT